jgi:hypothetical protein
MPALAADPPGGYLIAHPVLGKKRKLCYFDAGSGFGEIKGGKPKVRGQ